MKRLYIEIITDYLDYNQEEKIPTVDIYVRCQLNEKYWNKT